MKEKTLDIDKSVVDAIAGEVAKNIETQMDEKVKAFESKLAEIETKTEVEKSKLAGGEGEAEGEVVSKYAKLDKVDFAAEQFKAWVDKDHKKLAELNQVAIDSYKEKASYMNAGTPADGGAIVPNRELLGDVFSILGQYSELASDLRTITLTEGNGLDVALLVQDVVVSEVDEEGGDKPVTKLVFGEGQVDVREFAGIAILTKKLVRQAAVNIYELLQQSFARAIARKRAQIALTDASSGLINKAGVNKVTASAATVDGYKWADLKRMKHATPVSTRQGAKFYISAALLETLDLAVDGNGRDLELVKLDANGTSGTFADGTRFSVEEGLGVGDAPHAVYGAAGRFGILVRQGTVENETFDTGTVVDGNDVSHNLLQQNKLAQRVAFYENVGYPIENAFTILEPATTEG